MKERVLLLSKGYQPLRVISWRKAASLVIGREKAEIISEYSRPGFFKPAVIRLTVSSPDPFKLFQKQKFKKKHLFNRDKFSCQYCGESLNMKDGTIDHIIPRAQGGKTTYFNCVAACKPCNSIKDDRTPEQANMPLLKTPRYPNMYEHFAGHGAPQEWSMFLRK